MSLNMNIKQQWIGMLLTKKAFVTWVSVDLSLILGSKS